jgi:predicted metalloprotease
MINERKKTTLKPTVKPITPKKREVIEEPKKISVTEEPKKISVVEPTNKEEKKRKSEFKTLRVASNADIEERKQISDRVQKGELSLAYYAVDGENSYHYYFINKIN